MMSVTSICEVVIMGFVKLFRDNYIAEDELTVEPSQAVEKYSYHDN